MANTILELDGGRVASERLAVAGDPKSFRQWRRLAGGDRGTSAGPR
jgi:hypothetical protein